MTSSSQGLIHLISGFPQIMLLIPPLPSASLHLCVENSQDQQAALSCWIFNAEGREFMDKETERGPLTAWDGWRRRHDIFVPEFDSNHFCFPPNHASYSSSALCFSAPLR